MTAVVRRTTLEPIWTDNTAKYNSIYYWIDPDLSAVFEFPHKYWQEAGGVFSLVDQATRDAIDAAELIALDRAEKDALKLRFSRNKVLLALVKLLIDEFNILRAEHGLSPRTLAQLLTAIDNKIDGG